VAVTVTDAQSAAEPTETSARVPGNLAAAGTIGAGATASIEPHPRKLRDPSSLADESAAAMRYLSPLRYPGAKSGLVGVIGDLVGSTAEKLGKTELFVEPFAGGASTALRLAGAGIARRVLLADADPLVARFWQIAAADTDWLIDRMMDEPVTLERWDHWHNWQPLDAHDRDIAVKCLFLNRTTFSGILHGRAGPIGGRTQESQYKIDCRFNKEALATRLRFVGDLYESNRLADVWCKDWMNTLEDVAEWYPQLIPNQVIAYLDPPYWSKSPKLYRKSFDPAGGYAELSPKRPASPIEAHGWLDDLAHYKLADYLRHEARVRWILSYDDHPDLTQDESLYAARRMSPSGDVTDGGRRWHITKRLVDLRYSASATKEHRGKRQELLITTLPPSCVPLDDRFRAHPAESSPKRAAGRPG
jgi:DNA adenine methylase